MGTTYQIAEVAQRSGFTAATLRYYEGIGLLAPAGRTDAGYRVYDDASLDRLGFIARAKQLGCSLDEVAELATAWDGGRCGPVQDGLRAAVEAKVADAHARIAELTTLAADLRRAAAALSAHRPAGPCDATCGCTTAPAAAAMSAHRPAGPCGCTTAPVAPGVAAPSALGPAAALSAHRPAGPCDATCGCTTTAAAAAVAPGVAAPSALGPAAALSAHRPAGPCGCTTAPVAPGAVASPALGPAATGGGRIPVAVAGADAPIACTLGAGEMSARVDEWNAMLAGVTARLPLEDGVRLEFGPGTDVAELARLAAAEQGCCRFFGFAAVVDARGLALEVHAPPEAAAALTSLFGPPPP